MISTRFPLAEMAKRGWIPKVDDLRGRSEELMRGFVAEAGGLKTVPMIFLRQGKGGRYNHMMDGHALTAWCIRVQSLALGNPLNAKYGKNSIGPDTMREVARLSYFDDGPLLAREYLEKHGIHMIVVPHLPRTYLDGAAILLPDGTPAIGLTLRYDRIDNFWFCLLHELAHVSRHLSPDDRLIVDDLDLRGREGEIEDPFEKEADEMTRDGLIPKEVWDKATIADKVTVAELCILAAELKIHPAIIAGRVRYEQNNYRLLSKYVGNGQIRKHFSESFAVGV